MMISAHHNRIEQLRESFKKKMEEADAWPGKVSKPHMFLWLCLHGLSYDPLGKNLWYCVFTTGKWPLAISSSTSGE